MWLSALMPLMVWASLGAPDASDPPRGALAAAHDGCRLGDAEQDEFLADLNARRAALGLPPLIMDERLRRSALSHTLDMAASARLAHRGTGGKDFVERLRRANYEPAVGAENVAWNQADVGHVMSDWLASPSHRDAMLRPDVVHLGLARRCGDAGEPYWTLVLARPLGAEAIRHASLPRRPSSG